MTFTTLEKANELSRKIQDFEEALNCFDFNPEPDKPPFSLNPTLIIEYDGDGREQHTLPMHLSNAMVAFLKKEISKALELAVAEFYSL